MEKTTQDLLAKVRPAAPVNRIVQNKPSPAAFMMCSWCGVRGEDVQRTDGGLHRCPACRDRQQETPGWWARFTNRRYR